MLNIGIDASGGDNGEIEVIKAIINTFDENKNICYYIIGNSDITKSIFETLKFNYNNERIVFVDAKEKILMNDHPVFALRSKTNSSIVIAGKLLIDKKIDAFISAGNTGALVALSQLYLKPIKNVDRPVVGAIIPTKNNPMLLIDSGCNVDSKPEWLYQYAILGNVYVKNALKIKNPRIGLLSIGVEENKGNALTLSTYKLLKENKNLNFIGNVEARDVPNGVCDILVTDGFDGNVFLKTYEGVAKLLLNEIKNVMLYNFITKLCALIIKPYLKKVLRKYDAKMYGGAPILGTNYLVLKCHGNSTYDEFSYAIRQIVELINMNIINELKINME